MPKYSPTSLSDKTVAKAILKAANSPRLEIIVPSVVRAAVWIKATFPYLINPILGIDHPKPHNYALYKRRVTIITPNKKEAARISGIETEDEKSLLRAGRKLLAELGCEAVLITRGEEGMSLFQRNMTTHIPTKAKEVYDVTGAGDTVIAALTMALSTGASFEEAAVIANHAAGVVVSKLGTATVTPRELIDNIRADPY